LGGYSPGDLLQLRVIRQVMVNAHEQFVEFWGYLRHGGQHDDEGPVVLARDSLPRDGLDEFDAAHESMQVLEQQDRRAGALGDLRHGPDDSERVLCLRDAGNRDLLDGELHARIAVPDTQSPVFTPAQVGDFPGGLVGRDQFVEAAGERGGGGCRRNGLSGCGSGGFGHRCLCP